MKKIITVLTAMVLLFSLAGCGNGEKLMYESTFVYSGGGDQSSANLKDISVDITKDTEDVVLTFRFVNGSNTNADDQETAMKGLPPYQIAFLANPTRMMLTVTNLQYWDYQVNSSWSDPSGLIQGMFPLIPINDRTGATFYFNLSENVQYKLAESDGKLTVTLHKSPVDAVDGYYVTGNLFYEFQEGILTEGAGLTPTLCNDNISVLMISSRFDTEKDAQTFLDKVNNSYSSGLSGKSLNIIEQKSNVLPAYDDEMDLQAVLNRTILKIDGKETSLPLFFADARFLCWMPDGKKALFAKQQGNSESASAVQQLYLADQDGMKTPLFEQGLANISMAAFSSNGKMLAFVEESYGVQLCSIFDMETKQVKVLAEDAFGGSITGIAWNDDGTKLYAMAGDTMLLLREYDVAKEERTNLTEYPGIYTPLTCLDNYLYFVDVVDNMATVVKMNTQTDEFTSLVQGEDFIISENGRYIAVVRPDAEEGEGYGSLVLYDTVEETETVITKDAVLNDFFFNNDSSHLFYIADNMTEDAGQFVYSISQYDILEKKNEKLADCTAATFAPSNMPHEVIINVMYSKKEGDFPATYIARFQ